MKKFTFIALVLATTLTVCQGKQKSEEMAVTSVVDTVVGSVFSPKQILADGVPWVGQHVTVKGIQLLMSASMLEKCSIVGDEDLRLIGSKNLFLMKY